jgi:hypothetical protein
MIQKWNQKCNYFLTTITLETRWYILVIYTVTGRPL